MAEGLSIERRTGSVELTVPAQSEHLRVLRLVAASVAAGLDLDIDQLDDLRIAIDELCSQLIEHAEDGARLRLALVGDLGCLRAEGSVIGATTDLKSSIDSISQLILDGLDIEWSSGGEATTFLLVAPRQGAP